MDTPLVLLKGRGIRIRPKLNSSNVSSRKQLTNIQTLSALVLKFKSVAPQQLDMTWPKIPASWIWETATAVPLGTPDCTHPPLAVAAVAAKGLNSIRGRSASACTTWERGQNLDFSWRLFTVVYIRTVLDRHNLNAKSHNVYINHSKSVCIATICNL